jgi:hypothetical protein
MIRRRTFKNSQRCSGSDLTFLNISTLRMNCPTQSLTCTVGVAVISFSISSITGTSLVVTYATPEAVPVCLNVSVPYVQQLSEKTKYVKW